MDTLIVAGGNSTRRKQVKGIANSVLQHNFTAKERGEIGTVKVNLNPGNLRQSYAGDTGYTKANGTDIRLGRGLRRNDLSQLLTHELTHVVRRREGEPYRNERKIDLEVVGRLPASGIKNAKLGYYFSEKLRFPPHTSLNRKIELVRGQIRQDRRMLTGSVNKSAEGERLESRVDKMYKKSGIAKRRRYP